MPLVSMRQLLDEAAKGGYGVGAFNVNNMEQIQAIMEAARETQSPVIVQASRGARSYSQDKFLYHLMLAAAELYPEIPTVLHLDHGNSVETCKSAIELGFTSVMMDGSFLSFEDNIAITKKVLAVARPKNVSVEAELGKLSGVEERSVEEKEAILTDPKNAKDFVEKTGVDSLAIAIGTSHGAYKFKSQSKLDLDRLRIISEYVNIPLVLHGASSVPTQILEKAVKYGATLDGAKGVAEDQLQQAIKLGIAKINIDTDLRLAFTATVREILTNSPKEFDPRKILGPAKDAMKEVAKGKMRLFGSSGKA